MMLKLTNNSGGLLVCDLSVKGKTLRLNNKQSTVIKDSETTPHIKNLIAKGLVLSEEVSEETKSIKKNAVSKNSNKEKEE